MKTYIEHQNSSPSMIRALSADAAMSIGDIRHGIHRYLTRFIGINEAAIGLSIMMTICGTCLLMVYTAFGML